MVTKWINPQGGKLKNEDVSHFIDICPTFSTQILNVRVIFVDFDGDFQIIFRAWIYITFLCWFVCLIPMTGDKGNIDYPKAYIVCPLLRANRTPAECAESSPGPSRHHFILMGWMLWIQDVLVYDKTYLLGYTYTWRAQNVYGMQFWTINISIYL